MEASARPRVLPIGNLTSQLWCNFYLDGLHNWITETAGHGAYVRYTDDFLLFGEDKEHLWQLWAGIVEQLAAVRLKLAEPKSRLLATQEGVPFCGLRFLPGLRPRILGATKRRFERRRAKWRALGGTQRLSELVFSWCQFACEANSLGLRRRMVGGRRTHAGGCGVERRGRFGEGCRRSVDVAGGPSVGRVAWL